MTRREIVSRLRNDLNAHSADSVLTNRHLWNAFWTTSRVLIQREADTNKLKDQYASFKSYDLNTEQVDIYEGTCVPISCIACRVELPKVLTSKTGLVYSFLGSPDFHTRYVIVSPFEFQVKTKIKGSATRYAFVEGGFLYLSKCLPCLKLLAIPEEDDIEVGGVCSIMDEPVGISDYLVEGALILAKESLSFALQVPYDHSANKNTQA